MGLGACDNHTTDLHQHSGTAPMRVLHGFVSQPNIIRSMISRILESCGDDTKLLSVNGDMLKSDEPSSYIVRNASS